MARKPPDDSTDDAEPRLSKKPPKPKDDEPAKVAESVSIVAFVSIGESLEAPVEEPKFNKIKNQAFNVYVRNCSALSVLAYRLSGTSEWTELKKKISRNCPGPCPNKDCRGDRIFFVDCEEESFDVEFLLETDDGRQTVSFKYQINPQGPPIVPKQALCLE